MNKTIRTTVELLREGKDLQAIAKYLNPARGVPAQSDNCVVEAWHIAMRQIGKTAARPAPPPQRGSVSHPSRGKVFRGERRNLIFARRAVGNTKPRASRSHA